jgi:hypothetical protein
MPKKRHLHVYRFFEFFILQESFLLERFPLLG